jgi:hypothetical protein
MPNRSCPLTTARRQLTVRCPCSPADARRVIRQATPGAADDVLRKSARFCSDGAKGFSMLAGPSIRSTADADEVESRDALLQESDEPRVSFDWMRSRLVPETPNATARGKTVPFRPEGPEEFQRLQRPKAILSGSALTPASAHRGRRHTMRFAPRRRLPARRAAPRDD